MVSSELFSSFARASLCNRYNSSSVQEEAKILENGVIVEIINPLLNGLTHNT